MEGRVHTLFLTAFALFCPHCTASIDDFFPVPPKPPPDTMLDAYSSPDQAGAISPPQNLVTDTTVPKPYVCRECNHDCITKSNLSKHVSKKHRNTNFTIPRRTMIDTTSPLIQSY